jgi:hypothetical protein
LPTNGAIIGDDGEFADPAVIPVPTPASYGSDGIFDPQPELDRQRAAAFNQSGRASASPPAPKPGRFHHRSLRRFAP